MVLEETVVCNAQKASLSRPAAFKCSTHFKNMLRKIWSPRYFAMNCVSSTVASRKDCLTVPQHQQNNPSACLTLVPSANAKDLYPNQSAAFESWGRPAKALSGLPRHSLEVAS